MRKGEIYWFRHYQRACRSGNSLHKAQQAEQDPNARVINPTRYNAAKN